MSKLNPQKLKEIAHSNPTAELMFTAWALRERDRGDLNIPNFKKFLLKEGVKLDLNHFIKVFQELQREGIGHLNVGPRGKAKSFQWRTSMRDVGKMAMNGAKKRAKVMKVLSLKEREVLFYFPLKNGEIVPIRIPKQATQEDLGKLAEVISFMEKSKRL